MKDKLFGYKPSWEQAPPWANWLAADGIRLFSLPDFYKGWSSTLEQRPKEYRGENSISV